MGDGRIVLIGMCPNASGSRFYRPELVLTGRSGRRIADLAGLSWFEYLARTWRLNVLEEYPGRTWPVAQARRSAAALRAALSDRLVIVLGRAVAEAFDMGPVCPILEWFRFGGPGNGCVALLPHPSGMNRWYNDPANVERARAFLTEAFGCVTARA